MKSKLQVIGNAIGLFRHLRRQIVGDVVIHLVDLAVALMQRPGERDVAIRVSPDAVAKERDRIDEERTERDRFIEFRLHRQLARTAARS